MKRIILSAAILFSVMTLKAQTPWGIGGMNSIQPGFRPFNQLIDTQQLQKKWFLTKYVGLSAGMIGFNGTQGGFLSAPIGVQLNRQLTNNVIAFANVSTAPSYFPHINGFYQPLQNKNNAFMAPNRFGNYSTAQMGLMYINNDRTFSISGSFGVGRTDYFGGQPYYYNPARPGTNRNPKF